MMRFLLKGLSLLKDYNITKLTQK